MNAISGGKGKVASTGNNLEAGGSRLNVLLDEEVADDDEFVPETLEKDMEINL